MKQYTKDGFSTVALHKNPRIPVDRSGFYYIKDGFKAYSMEIT